MASTHTSPGAPGPGAGDRPSSVHWTRRAAFVCLVIAAVSGLAWALETPVTNYLARRSAGDVDALLATLADDNPLLEGEVEADRWAGYYAADVGSGYWPTPAPVGGDAFAVITLPERIGGGAWRVVEGTTAEHLRQGPGHLVGTALPGNLGNAVVSGHRTTWGAPFNRIDELAPGDEIVVDTATGRHVYAVTETFIVSPTDTWVADSPEDPVAWLTLTACHPKGSARQRVIVRAELVGGPNAAFVSELSAGIDPDL
jgi:LPXTG-site transpeptidase (sortase) family protein